MGTSRRFYLNGGNSIMKKSIYAVLEEETGLKVGQMAQFKTYDAIDRDPRHRTISVVHSVELKERQPVKGNDDAACAAWFPIDNLPELGFDHRQILKEFFSKHTRKDL